jgi:hypothetical protein
MLWTIPPKAWGWRFTARQAKSGRMSDAVQRLADTPEAPAQIAFHHPIQTDASLAILLQGAGGWLANRFPPLPLLPFPIIHKIF